MTASENPCLSVVFCFVVVTFFAANTFRFHFRSSRTHCAKIVLLFLRLFFRRGHACRALGHSSTGFFHRPLGVRLQQPEIPQHHFQRRMSQLFCEGVGIDALGQIVDYEKVTEGVRLVFPIARPAIRLRYGTRTERLPILI